MKIPGCIIILNIIWRFWFWFLYRRRNREMATGKRLCIRHFYWFIKTHTQKNTQKTTTKLLHPQVTYAHPDTSPRFTPCNDKTLPVEILHITVFNHRERI